jgi:hypothetical protein
MKVNSNDILFDIINQLYTRDIFNQLMSPNVDTNLIDLIEQTIEKITTVENEENQKLRNRESSQEDVYNVNYNKINPSGSFWVMAKNEGFGVPNYVCQQ